MSINPPTAYENASLLALDGEQRLFMTAAFNRGIAATATLQLMSDAGIGVRKTNGLAAFRAISGAKQLTVGINSTPFALQPSSRLFTPIAKDIFYNYRVWGYVDATTATGETVRLRAVFGFNDLNRSRLSILEGMAAIMQTAAQSLSLDFATEDIIITTAESKAL